MSDYDDFQTQLKGRQFCVGWRYEGSHEKIYYEAVYDSWHEAEQIARGAASPGMIPFVEATETKPCPRCSGTGCADVVGNDYNCTRCHGKGRVRMAV